MSSFFTIPGSQKKRKRTSVPEAPKKRVAGAKTSTSKAASRPNGATKRRVERDESISGSDSDDDENYDSPSDAGDDEDVEDRQSSDEEGETAAEKRLRLAERYLENVKEHVDEAGFDAADIDRDLIAERLQEDVAETKGRVYRQLAAQLAFNKASQTFFRSNTNSVTSIAACSPFVYTATKDLVLHKWRIQDLPQDQFPQTTKRKPKKPPAPPRKRPQLVAWIKGRKSKSKDRNYKRHTGQILAVAASPDGKYVVTGGEDKKLIIYEADTLTPIKVMTHHRDAVTGLAFRRGTNQLYSSSRDRTVKVWSLDELAYIETLFGHQDHVVDIDALAQERCVSVGARDRTARLWKVMEETQLVFRGGAVDRKNIPQGVDPRSLLHEGSMDRISMIDDDLFVTGSDNGAIALWSVTKKKPVYIQPLAHGLDPALDPLAASAEANPDAKKVVPAPTPRWITALRTIPYSDIILSGSWDGHVRVWKLTEDKKKIEQIGVLGDFADDYDNDSVEDAPTANGTAESHRPIPGVVNDIAVFERGERGKDGLCVVAAVAREHRFGRWKVFKDGVRNGGVVFEVSRIPTAEVNGNHEDAESVSDDDE
ncbi:rRNA processing protein RRP9 [Pochonia chlamydosporia 170]|uniref:rRNA processing protein RRP9 n=1 Tax=Pochonia chlamydosporia 170 TaxID=1380566 RepID=A0A179FGT3_METCM|nr:rRNA processing protein RRP9 [Pochonia chlamydosporia 170]OAQ64617.1 rRNA processing protein RRP9 [Pochonia chlamydosporia 170]